MNLVPSSLSNNQLPEMPNAVLPIISKLTQSLGIPRDVLASDEDITYAWKDLPRELHKIPIDADTNGELLARMCIAVSTGLFDSAINYAWNASVLSLREKVENFGLPIVAQILQKDFEKKQLLELQDSQLIDLCLKLNLITEDGFFFLDQNRNTRNNFSAAHPTIGQLNDREFIAFLNRCVQYALAASSSPRGVDVSAFISAVKGGRFTDGQCMVWVNRLDETHDAQRELLFGTLHGIYCDPSTPEPARLNTLDLCNRCKNKFTATVRSNLINRHQEYLATGNEKKYKASLDFFEKLNLLGILNESERHTVISSAIKQLWSVHNGMNNFYNEPLFAERLEILSRQGAMPETVKEEYVQVVVCCYIGNGYGVSLKAEPFYAEMIREFSPREIEFMINITDSKNITARRIRGNSFCRNRFKQALELIDVSSVPNKLKANYTKLINSQTF